MTVIFFLRRFFSTTRRRHARSYSSAREWEKGKGKWGNGGESTPTGNAGGRNFFFMRWLGRLRDLSLVSEEFLGLLLPNPGDEQPLLSAEYRAPA